MLAAVLPGSKIHTPLTIHVATTGIWIKTSLMQNPVMWNAAPMRIERTTADCLWKCLEKACPFGPWGIMPASSACVWIVFVLCCDEASSNKRMIAHFEVVALAKRVNVIVWFSPCFLHILHRAVMPALKRDNLIGDLYRATHVLVISSYWAALMKASQRLYKAVIIMHDPPPISEHDARVNDQILQVTLYNGKTQDNVSKSMRDLGREITTFFFVVRGAWCVVRGAWCR